MELKKIAESIVNDLNNLENRSSSVLKICHTYKELQIEIVLENLTAKETSPFLCSKCSRDLRLSYCPNCGLYPGFPKAKMT